MRRLLSRRALLSRSHRTTIATSIWLLSRKAEHLLLSQRQASITIATSNIIEIATTYYRDEHLTTIATSKISTILYCGEHQLVLSINIATTTTAMSNIILSRSHRLLSRRPSITIDYYCDKQYYRDRIATTIATSIWLIDQDEKFHSLLAVQKKHPDCIDFCPNEQ
jgi:hypothetical protein